MLLFEGDGLSTEPHIQQRGRVSTTMAEQLKIREEDGVVHLKRMGTRQENVRAVNVKEKPS